jgi:hypothetical protein
MIEAAAAVGVAAMVLAGCSETKVIDDAKLKTEITNLFQAHDVEVAAVTCPEEIEVHDGRSFDCEATTTDGLALPVDVTMTDGNGTVDIAAGPDVLLVSDDEVQVAAQRLADDLGMDVNITCPRVQLLPEATGSVSCEGEGAGGIVGTVEMVYEKNQLVDVR